MKSCSSVRRGVVVLVLALVSLFAGGAGALLGVCGPFTDVAADAFCPFVLEIFYLGITTGTTPTTYDPAATVNRLQMAAFLSRTVDGVLKRGSRRAALGQFWTAETNASLALTTVGLTPQLPISDGEDVWVPNYSSGTVSRVHGSNGRLLESWTGAVHAVGALAAMGKIFVTGNDSPGKLYRIDSGAPAGVVTTLATNLGDQPQQIVYDGSRMWTGNNLSVSIVTPSATIPWTVTTVTTGFNIVVGMVYDGANVWAASVPGGLKKLDAAGAILQTVTMPNVGYPVFDGSNIWVGNFATPSVTVVRASNGAILATLTGNGLVKPAAAAFDGQRILVTNQSSVSSTVSLWKAADLSPLGSFAVGTSTTPNGACSDGVNFWITLFSTHQLARF